MTDGVWFPFSYKEIQYNNDEIVFKINRNFEKVALNAEIDSDDFTIEIPAGTYIVDTILGGPIKPIKEGGVYSIEDFK